MMPIARTASTVSAVLTGNPAVRSAVVKPTVRSSRLMLALPSGELQLRTGPVLVRGVLQNDAQCGGHGRLVQRVQAEGEQRVRPVDRLRDTRALLEFHRPHRPGGADQGFRELLGQLRYPGQ